MRRVFAAIIVASIASACSGNAGLSTPFVRSQSAQLRPAAGPPVVSGCTVFPTPAPGATPSGQNWWNVDVSKYPVDPNSATYISHLPGNLHPDFGHEPYYGIPFNVVPQNQPGVPVSFRYNSQSDKGPYPIPPNAQVEGAPKYHTGDLHVLVLQQGTCKLYETWDSHEKDSGKSWTAGSGAIFDLSKTKLRPNGWTSADAAGLPIFPALIKCDEVAAGEIDHALRVTFNETQRGYIHPATHFASSSKKKSLPPMGLRLRLKASYDISRFHGASEIILQAMKTYGMLVADNGSNWYFQGQGGREASCWNDNDLNQLKGVPGSAFEVVKTGPIVR